MIQKQDQLNNQLNKKVDEIQELLLTRYPNWSQDKARWMALQAAGVLKPR